MRLLRSKLFVTIFTPVNERVNSMEKCIACGSGPVVPGKLGVPGPVQFDSGLFAPDEFKHRMTLSLPLGLSVHKTATLCLRCGWVHANADLKDVDQQVKTFGSPGLQRCFAAGHTALTPDFVCLQCRSPKTVAGKYLIQPLKFLPQDWEGFVSTVVVSGRTFNVGTPGVLCLECGFLSMLANVTEAERLIQAKGSDQLRENWRRAQEVKPLQGASVEPLRNYFREAGQTRNPSAPVFLTVAGVISLLLVALPWWIFPKPTWWNILIFGIMVPLGVFLKAYHATREH
ncbi:MAG: hypothetical protein AB1705_01125 [Verrucomicrobiota bacterium]